MENEESTLRTIEFIENKIDALKAERQDLNKLIESWEATLSGERELLKRIRIENDQCIGCGKYIDTAHSPEGAHVCSDCYCG
jgi:hypothetical protein